MGRTIKYLNEDEERSNREKVNIQLSISILQVQPFSSKFMN